MMDKQPEFKPEPTPEERAKWRKNHADELEVNNEFVVDQSGGIAEKLVEDGSPKVDKMAKIHEEREEK